MEKTELKKFLTSELLNIESNLEILENRISEENISKIPSELLEVTKNSVSFFNGRKKEINNIFFYFDLYNL